jgi:flagellar M-ring protein FliF
MQSTDSVPSKPMDNAIASPVPTPLVPATPGLGARWAAMPAKTRLYGVLGALALVSVLVLMTGSARDGDYRVLFPSLSDKDGGLIVDKLTQMNVPYKFAEGGGTIMVPASRVHELRMKLSASGLPKGGGSGTEGYELLDKSSFGQTQGQERMAMQRAVEGELTRTIQSLDSVASARVHLALPNQNGFFREQQKPSASVALTLHPGRTLERAQLAGIVHLVSSSVPELNHKAVTVVDGSGALLSGQPEGDEAGLDSQQLQFRREVEAGYLKRVLALLEPVVGSENVRASITADIDFSQVMQAAETYRPNQGANAQPAIREQRTEEATEPGGSGAGGVPGATTNQPPTPAPAPLNGPAQALQGAPGALGAGGAAARRDTATRYEVDKTVTVTRSPVGAVRRLNAAVVVNNKTTVDAKGKSTTSPLNPQEIEQLTALVQQGIGFDAQRGDAVRVVNAPFRVDTPPPVEEVPIYQQPWLTDLLRSAAAPGALALVALVIVFTLLRPALTAMLAPAPASPPGTQLDEVVGEDGQPLLAADRVLPQLEAPRINEKLEAARALAKQNPAAVANIVRGWVNGEAA